MARISLSHREAQIVALLSAGETYKNIGRIIGVSTQRVYQIAEMLRVRHPEVPHPVDVRRERREKARAERPALARGIREPVIAAMVRDGRTYAQIGVAVKLGPQRVLQIVSRLREQGALPRKLSKEERQRAAKDARNKRREARQQAKRERAEPLTELQRRRRFLKAERKHELDETSRFVQEHHDITQTVNKHLAKLLENEEPELTEEDKRMLAEGWERL